MRAEAPPVAGTMPEDFLPGLVPLLKEALARSPNTISADVLIAQREGERFEDSAVLLPSLNGQVNAAESRASTAGEPASTAKGLFYNVSLNQPIFQWGAYRNSSRIGKLNLQIAERQYAEAYRTLALSLREQYLGLIEKKVQVRNDLYRKKLSQEAVDTAKAKLEAGSASKVEASGAQATLDQVDLQADRSSEEYGHALRVFARLAGIDRFSDASVPTSIPHPTYSAPTADAILTGFVGGGVESTFQSQVYSMLIKTDDLNYAIARVRQLPKFSGAATYGRQNNVNGSYQYTTDTATIGITGNWDIFDGLYTHGAKLQSLALKRRDERQLKDYVDSTIDTITYMRHQLDFSARTLAFSEAGQSTAEAQVKQLTDDHRLGYASQASVENAVLYLYLADIDTSNSRADYFSRWIEFVSLAGIDPILSNIPTRYVR